MRLKKSIVFVVGHLLAMLSVVTVFGVIPAFLVHRANRDTIADPNSYAGMSFFAWIGGMVFVLGIVCVAFLVAAILLRQLHRYIGMKNWIPLAVLAGGIVVLMLTREVVPSETATRLRRVAELAAAFALYWAVIIVTQSRFFQRKTRITTKHCTLSAGAAEA
jgi:hypothetical protein